MVPAVPCTKNLGRRTAATSLWRNVASRPSAQRIHTVTWSALVTSSQTRLWLAVIT
jgi:hypothetical protein